MLTIAGCRGLHVFDDNCLTSFPHGEFEPHSGDASTPHGSCHLSSLL